MRKFYYLVLFLLVLAVSGCATAEKNAYRTLATTSTLVDKAMTTWADYVVKGLANEQDELKVRKAYATYQKAMVASKLAVYSYRSSKKENADEVTATAKAVSDSALEIIKVIQEIVKKE